LPDADEALGHDGPQSAPKPAASSGDSGSRIHANCATSRPCYAVQPIADGLHLVTALNVAADGTFFIVEDGRHVRVIPRDRSESIATLRAAAGTRIVDVVPHPTFATTGHVLVGIAEQIGASRASEASGRASRHFTVVRYRWAADRMGDAAVVIASLPLEGDTDPRFTIDAAGRIYVAMPASDRRLDPYAGMILRFNADGTVPSDSRAASPVFAEGYRAPTSVAADDRHLWLTAADPRSHRWSRLSLDPSADPDLRRVGLLADVDVNGTLHILAADGEAEEVVELTEAGEMLVGEAVAIGGDRTIYVALRRPAGFSAIVLLTRESRAVRRSLLATPSRSAAHQHCGADAAAKQGQ
jgi:hypothetical protein